MPAATGASRACQRDFRPCGRHSDYQRHFTDSAGNSSTQTHNVQVNTAQCRSRSAPSAAIILLTPPKQQCADPERHRNELCRRYSGDLLLNGKGYSATIQSNGSWSVTCRRQTLRRLPMAPATRLAPCAGQRRKQRHGFAQRGGGSPAPVISINTVSTDDRLNAAENSSR